MMSDQPDFLDPDILAPVPEPAQPDSGYDSSGVPTFESVREKIESRYATSVGATELDAGTPEGQALEEHYEERRRAAAERLGQIREAMRNEQS
jgi:phage shock protein A